LSKVFQALNENNFNPRILYPTKLSFKIDEAETKTIYDHQATLQKILQGILHTEKQNHERRGSTKPQEKKDKESESNTDSAAHNQTLKQQKQLNGRITTYLSILTLLMDLTPPSKDTVWQTELKRKIQQSVVYRRPISLTETGTGLG
jgi:hypothetical protein